MLDEFKKKLPKDFRQQLLEEFLDEHLEEFFSGVHYQEEFLRVQSILKAIKIWCFMWTATK